MKILIAFMMIAMTWPAMAADSVTPPVIAKEKTPEVIDYFAPTNRTMHEAMTLQPSGNIDVDFARGMIAHHQGAIDMAKVHLKYSKDPELRALSEAIIKAQDPEIKQMQDWLDAHPQKK